MKASASLQSESRKDSSMSRRIATAGVELMEVKDSGWHIDLDQAGEETAKDQIATCIEKIHQWPAQRPEKTFVRLLGM